MMYIYDYVLLVLLISFQYRGIIARKERNELECILFLYLSDPCVSFVVSVCT